MQQQELKVFVIGLLKTNNINIKNEEDKFIINKIVSYIDALIFNIVSIACIISILNGDKSIKKENLDIIKKYIQDRCSFKYNKNGMKGGAFNTAAFYGMEEPMYKEENEGKDILGIDWSSEIVRPQIGGGKNIKNKNISKIFICKQIKKILKYHGIKATNEIIEELLNIIDYHLKCLLGLIKKCGKKYLNIKCLKNIINKNKILSPMK
jgi:hypothetical protein